MNSDFVRSSAREAEQAARLYHSYQQGNASSLLSGKRLATTMANQWHRVEAAYRSDTGYLHKLIADRIPVVRAEISRGATIV